MEKLLLPAIVIITMLSSCSSSKTAVRKDVPFVWGGANMYFLLVDRFANGDASNDITLGRTKKAGKLRGFEGGDIRGIIQKIDEGFFDRLGINAIWLTPIGEQIHDATNEGTGNTYGFHGYWAKDWTRLDPNFGTEEDLAEMVQIAHRHGIRIVLDGVINHTGPVTELDAAWPADWVRTEPQCKYDNYESTTSCTLVKNLPDVLTENNENVVLPQFLVDKWKAEGRYEQEVKELDVFFDRTGYPRAPKYYIIKWLTDYIAEYGIDGYRADTVKHVGEDIWASFSTQCDYAFAEWKKNNPGKVLDDTPFFTVGEVYGYGIWSKQFYDFGDKKVNYFENGFDALINFEMKYDAAKPYEETFTKYSNILNGELNGKSVLNYLASHDDGGPFDKKREKAIEAGTRLLLTPGISQVYYGDESARPLDIPGTEGDATLRSFMNWEDIASDAKTQSVLLHWQKLGQFRRNHPAVGAGRHALITSVPYVFERTNNNDSVVIGLDLPEGAKTITTADVFAEGAKVRDAYSGKESVVKEGNVTMDTEYTILLLEKK